MKKYFLLYKILFLSIPGFTQLNISTGTQWVTSGNATVVLQDMNFVNDGSLSAGAGSFKFMGTQNSTISGSTMPSFNLLEMAKTNAAKILLSRNINVGSSINFISGQLDLNGSSILLGSTAYIAGETENNRITGTNGGFIEITQNLNAPVSANPGNLGAIITSSANLGSVTIRRGHSSQSGTGLPASINRYYNIQPTNNINLNATLRFKYFDSELNAQTEGNLVQFKSTDNGATWVNQSFTTRDAAMNYVEKTGIQDLALITLANDNTPPTPVTGLVFTGSRKKATEVQLNWTTATETNMKGFELQRKLDNETAFSARTFVNSKAPGGTSATPLSYMYTDANAYTGVSYYRLKIVDLANNISYSQIVTIAAKTKGGGGGNPHNNIIASDTTVSLQAAGKILSPFNTSLQKITVGPNPNNGNFWFIVNGIDKETVAILYSIDGKQLKQFRVKDQQQQQVNGLRSGIYILKVPGFEAYKIIVHGNSSGFNNIITESPLIKN